MNLLSRLRRTSPEEIAWRTRQLLRVQRDRVHTRLRTAQWDRATLLPALAPAVVDPVLRSHLERRDWRAANESLLRILQARPRAFMLDPSNAQALRDQILTRWPEAASNAAERADRVIGGAYDCLGYSGLSYADDSGRIDWHFDPVHHRRAPKILWADVPFLDPDRVGDHKIIWEINRHQHWLALGRALWLTRDRRYGQAIVSQLEQWMEANPPLIGINWASALELGFRSLSWLWALHFLMADADRNGGGRTQEPWLVDLLIGVDRHARHIEENLSYYFSPNTHLLGEALALYAVGVSLPELASSARWMDTGRRILVAEIDRQISPDGGHIERSLHYHRYALDFYLFALLLARRSHDGAAIARFTDAAARLAEFAYAMADDSGRLSLLGDDDGGSLWPIMGRPCTDIRDSLAVAAVVLARPDLARWGVPEEVFWIAGPIASVQVSPIEARRHHAAAPESTTFPDTGYVVTRDGEGGHLIFDAGPHGFRNGGHAHADALSLTLTLGGHPFLVDPGTSTYTMDRALRDRMRSTASHNTLTLNGRPSSVPAGPFHWQTYADARLNAVRHNPVFDWAEAEHEGFPGLGHRRTVLRSPAGSWLIVDEVLGGGPQSADLHWHVDPAWGLTREAATRLRATHLDGVAAWIVHDGDDSTLLHGDERSGLGWFAPAYGMLMPTWCARVSRAGAAPFSIATWIGAGDRPPELIRLVPECDPGGSAAVGVQASHEDVLWTTLLRPGEPAGRGNRGCAAAGYHTNGRLLHYASRDGRLASLAVCDATHVLALREGWVSVDAAEPIPDLYLELAGETINIWSSALTASVRLEGAAVAVAREVRVNGRPLPDRARQRPDALVVLPADSGAAGRITPCVASQVSQI